MIRLTQMTARFLLIVSFLFPVFAGAQSINDLESKIAALLSQIQILQSELEILKTTEQTPPLEPSAPKEPASNGASFTQTLGKGSEGSEVTALQTYLAKDPSLYPEGTISGYYGALTEQAVKRFQQKHNIVSSGTPLTTGYGTVGPKTRATLNSLLAATSSTPTTPAPTPTPTPTPAPTPNRSPNLSITGDRFITLPNKATLTAVATDDGKPASTDASQGGPGSALTYLWSKASGPGTVSFSSLTTKDTTLTFSSPGTYHVTATVSDSDLFASYTVTLIVSPASTTATSTPPTTTLPSPSLTFTGSKTTLTKGTATTLTWSSTNTTSCTASNGWTGSKTASGSTTLTPQTTTTYTLSCKGGGGDQVAKSVTVTVTGTSPAPNPTPTGDTVSLYGTWEKSFTNNKNYSNPYDFNEIQLDAVFTAPSGRKVNFFGFYDGNGNGGQTGNIWKLRFLPDETGTWTYTYSWSDGTTGGSGSFTAANDGKYKGVLKPYAANPHWFAYNETDPVFLKSYYIAHRIAIAGMPINWTASNVYQKLIDNGYNHLQLNLLNVSWTDSKFLDAPSHNPDPLWGSDPVNDQRMDVWKRMEEHVSWLNDRNVGIHLFTGFDPKEQYDNATATGDPCCFSQKRWMSMSSSEKERYVKYVVARLAPYANIAGWNYAWEVQDVGGYELAGLLGQYDPWEHLRTYHSDNLDNHNFNDPRYTFAAIEEYNPDGLPWPNRSVGSYPNHRAILKAYVNKPVYMMEGSSLWYACYHEASGGYSNWNSSRAEDDARRAAWAIATAAGSFTWSDHPGCGNPAYSSDVLGTAESVDYIDTLFKVMEQDVVFYKMNPHDDLITNKSATEVWALAEPGKQYLVYAEAGADFNLSIASGTYTATWINTQTNTRQNANGGSVTGGTRSFTPPSSADWVLILKK